MPIPNPKSNENKSTFVSRCISEIKDEYKQDQRIAICISTWDNKKFKEYPWAKCMEDQQKRGYGVKTSEKICGWIKAQNQ